MGNANNVSNSAEKPPPPEPVEKVEEAQAVCPTDDDIHNFIDEMKKLQANAHLFLVQTNKQSTQNGDQTDQLEGLRKRIEEWKDRETSTTANCYLLSGADGTEVNPQLPRTLDALSRSKDYLLKSLKAHELKNDEMAKIFFAFAQDNLKHAEKISQMHNHLSRAKPLKAPAPLTKADDWLKEESK